MGSGAPWQRTRSVADESARLSQIASVVGGRVSLIPPLPAQRYFALFVASGYRGRPGSAPAAAGISGHVAPGMGSEPRQFHSPPEIAPGNRSSALPVPAYRSGPTLRPPSYSSEAQPAGLSGSSSSKRDGLLRVYSRMARTFRSLRRFGHGNRAARQPTLLRHGPR